MVIFNPYSASAYSGSTGEINGEGGGRRGLWCPTQGLSYEGFGGTVISDTDGTGCKTNTLVMCPVAFTHDMDWRLLAIRHGTYTAIAPGNNIRFAFYESVSSTNFLPGSKLQDTSHQLAESASGGIGSRLDITSWPVEAGRLYWIGYILDTRQLINGATVGTPDQLGYRVAQNPIYGFTTLSGFGMTYNTLSKAHDFTDPLPDNPFTDYTREAGGAQQVFPAMWLQTT
jgi:hypothetical protein